MGQKIHPVGLRLGITRTWDSRWFEKKNYVAWLHEDVAIRKYFGRMTRAAAISRVEIERRANQARIIINTGKPGIIIGKRGVGIDEIRRNLETLTGKQVQVNVVEIKTIELDARLVGQNIVDQLEKRIAFRRAMKQAIMRTMKAGARGVKVQVSGRLGGAEIARTERNHDGKVPLHTLRADIDYAHVEAFTTFGRIGVKVWIYKGEVLPEGPRGEREGAGGAGRSGDGARFRDNRRGTRGGRGRGGAAGTEGRGEGRAPRPVTDAPVTDAAVTDAPATDAPANDVPANDVPAIDTSDALRAAQTEGASLESVIDGGAAAEHHHTAPHAGAVTHEPDAEHGAGVTTETSQVNPESQHTTDAQERPGAPSTAPTATHPEPAPGTLRQAQDDGTHDRPELDTTNEVQ
jgi:small subunit ribosomal protein S3